jgi:hypothetical protein
MEARRQDKPIRFRRGGGCGKRKKQGGGKSLHEAILSTGVSSAAGET